jgi:hypothetical protein
MNEVQEFEEFKIMTVVIIFTPWIINIFLYYYWKYRAKKAMERDKIDYWIQSYDICNDFMGIMACLWLFGTVSMILSLIFDREY